MGVRLWDLKIISQHYFLNIFYKSFEGPSVGCFFPSRTCGMELRIHAKFHANFINRKDRLETYVSSIYIFYLGGWFGFGTLKFNA